MTASGANMRLVTQAKAHHDATCRYRGRALEAHLNPGDVDRLEWADGDQVAGLTIRADPKQRAGYVRVYCDVELQGQGGGGVAETADQDARDTVLA